MGKISGKRRGVIRDDDRRRTWFMRDETRCDACGITWGQATYHRVPALICVHHIIQGPGRSDEECNFLRVCSQCHSAFHGARTTLNGQKWPPLGVGYALRIKRLRYPEEWDLARLVELAGYASPPDHFTEKELPEFYLAERRKWKFGNRNNGG